MNLTEKQKQWLAWGIVALVLTLVSILFGVTYPIPEPPLLPPADEEVILGTTHFTNVEAEDVTVTDDLAVTDDASVGGAFAVTGATTLAATTTSGDITFANGTTLGEAVDTVLDLSEFLAFTEQTAISVTAQAYLTPTGTYQPLTSAAAVSTSLTTAIMSGTVSGQLLILVNENASDAITIVDGANTAMGGDKVLTGGQGDAIWLMWDLTNWLCIGYNDN